MEKESTSTVLVALANCCTKVDIYLYIWCHFFHVIIVLSKSLVMWLEEVRIKCAVQHFLAVYLYCI